MIIVTYQGPIDRHPPGTDVTDKYRGETLQRLIAEGYLMDQDRSDDVPIDFADIDDDSADGVIVADMEDTEDEGEDGSD